MCVARQADHAADRPTPAASGNPYVRLRRWAHMLGFGGHFLTKSRTYSITFGLLRNERVVFRRRQTSGPDTDVTDTGEVTTLVVNFLQFVGAGWQTPADAMLANTSAAMRHRLNLLAYVVAGVVTVGFLLPPYAILLGLVK